MNEETLDFYKDQLKYAGFLFTFYLKSKGRNDRYRELKKIIDEAVKNTH